MAARVVSRRVPRRLFSSGGRILGKEEQAAEKVYIKKMEQEKLEKLAQKGTNAGGQTLATAEAPASAAKSSGPASSASASLPTGKKRNYAVLGGTVAAVLSGLGWYFFSKTRVRRDRGLNFAWWK